MKIHFVGYSRLGRAFQRLDQRQGGLTLVQADQIIANRVPTLDVAWETECQSREAMRRLKPRKSALDS